MRENAREQADPMEGWGRRLEVAAMRGGRSPLVVILAVVLCFGTAFLIARNEPGLPDGEIAGPQARPLRSGPDLSRVDPEGGTVSSVPVEPREGDPPRQEPPPPARESPAIVKDVRDSEGAWDLEGVRVESELVSTSVVSGDTIPVRVRIWNDSGYSLSLPSPQAEWMSNGLIGATMTYEGASLPPFIPGFATGPRPRQVVPPGKCIEVVFDLAEGCRLQVPGEYRVRVSYDPEGLLGKSKWARECPSEATLRVVPPSTEGLRKLMDRVAWEGDWPKIDFRALEAIGDIGSPEASDAVINLAERARRDLAKDEDIRGLKAVYAAILCAEKFQCWEWIRRRDLDQLRDYARRGSRGDSERERWIRFVTAITGAMENGKR